MPICPYCNANAGLFKQSHPQCERDYQLAIESLPGAIRTSLLKGETPEQMLATANRIAERGRLKFPDISRLCMAGWSATLDAYLSGGVLSDYEQARLKESARLLGLTEADLMRQGIPGKIAMARGLAALIAGQIAPSAMMQYCHETSSLPFLLQASESLVWAFDGTHYYEEKTRHQRVSQSRGVSMRVARGMYYRVGASVGHTIENTAMELQSTGILAITTKHIIFGGETKSLRIPYKKIVTIHPYSDGFGVIRDAATARLQNFVTQRGWFAYNLVMHVAAQAA